MSEDLICHFGKHKGKPMSELSTGYLRWAVKTIDPMPSPKYRVNEDGSAMSVEEVKAMEERMRTFLYAAEDAIHDRETDGGE